MVVTQRCIQIRRKNRYSFPAAQRVTMSTAWSRWRAGACLALALFLSACATPETRLQVARKFDFQKDTFAYSNDLVWEYYFDARGKWVYRRRSPKPDYTHHCFVVARTARQFFLNARFEPSAPRADEFSYRRLIRKVASSNPRKPLAEESKIV